MYRSCLRWPRLDDLVYYFYFCFTLVILLLICFRLDTTVHGISSWCGTIAIGLEMNPKFGRFQEFGHAFSYIVPHVWGCWTCCGHPWWFIEIPLHAQTCWISSAWYFLTTPVTRLPVRTPSTVSLLCLPFFAFWWQGFQLALSPLRLQGVLGQLVRQMLPGHLTSASWHVAIPRGRTEDRLPSVFREKRSEEIPTCRWFFILYAVQVTLLVLSARTRPQSRTPQRHWKSQKEREEAKQKRHLRNEKPEADVSWVQDERERESLFLPVKMDSQRRSKGTAQCPHS